MNLNQVTIPITEIDKSIKFYEDLGLELIVHTHNKYARFVCPDGQSSLSLHVVDSISALNRTIIYFELINLDEFVAQLIQKGIEIDMMPKNQSWLWRECHLTDPDDNPIILYFAGENRLNPPWRKVK